MKTFRTIKASIFFLIPVVAQVSWGLTCHQTLSPGANLAAAMANAPNDTTICLNSGDYGTVELNNINRTGYVTLTSASPMGATISPRLGNSKFMRFDQLTLTTMVLNNNCADVQITNSTFIPNKGGLALVASTRVLVDNVDFTNVNMLTWTGRLVFNNTSFSQVKNSKFIGVGQDSVEPRYAAADGVMVIGGANNTTIGPNNVFANILQSQCDIYNPGSHCDSIQLYGAGLKTVITENYFVNDAVFIMAPDGSDDVTVTNNVFNGTGIIYDWKIQFGTANGVLFEHNTLANTGVTFDSKPWNPASTNILAKNNIILNNGIRTSGGNGCVGNCVFTNNLFGSSSIAVGTNNLIGLPTFLGGTNPVDFAGFKLSSSSIGYRAATDGKDMGIAPTTMSTPPGPILTLAAPSNLRFIN